jgi:cytochrome c-type biogenesis protein CcmH
VLTCILAIPTAKKFFEMLWLVLISMTCVAVLAALLPLALKQNPTNAPKSLASYHSKILSEINQDIECGLMDANEAEAIKIEAARRLLLLETEGVEPSRSSSRVRTLAAVIVCLFIPGLSVPLYMHLGRQGMHDQPLAGRIALIPGHKDTLTRIVELEAYIRKHPKDGRAYEMIAPFYQRELRFEEAVKALETALRLLGASAPRYAALGEAKVVGAHGEVPSDAILDFEQALKIDSKDILARYYLGVAAAQSGDKEKAGTIWSGLLADAPKGSDWAKQVEDDLQELLNAKNPRKL